MFHAILNKIIKSVANTVKQKCFTVFFVKRETNSKFIKCKTIIKHICLTTNIYKFFVKNVSRFTLLTNYIINVKRETFYE